MSTQYVFENIKTLIEHINAKSSRTVTPLRLQKTLYFMFAFYGSTYGQFNKDNDTYMKEGGGLEYPKYLFPDEFEAWQYGPVIREVYRNFKYNEDEYGIKEWVPETEQEKDILGVLTEVISEVDSLGDFTLVERSHEDQSWISAYEKGNGAIIEPERIVEDYISNADI